MSKAKKLIELQQNRHAELSKMEGIITKGESEKRSLTDKELQEFRSVESNVNKISFEIQKLDVEIEEERSKPTYDPNGSVSNQFNDGEVLALRSNQALSNLDPNKDNLSVGKYIRGIVTGNWEGADKERRAMSESVLAGGGYLVPTPLSAGIIDIARNIAVVMKAGALTIPMDSSTLTMARVKTAPTASWKGENLDGSETSMDFESLKLSAKTLFALIKMSLELFEDADNIDGIVQHALGEALALELDRAALRGSGVGNEPKGIRNQTNVQIIDMGTNGAAPTYSVFSQGVEKIQNVNGDPTVCICAARTLGTLDRLVDSTGQPVRPLPSFEKLNKLCTNQVPINLTKGTSTTASEAYIGGFENVLIGLRKQITIEVSRVAGDAFTKGQVWVRAYLRADVAIAKPEKLLVIDGLI